MLLSAINLHPVKSTAIRPVQQAYVGEAGLVGDREWMVVDPDGEAVTARTVHRMLHVVADNAATGGTDELLLSAARLGMSPLAVPVPEDGVLPVTVHGRGPYPGRPAGDEADRWLQRALGIEAVRLVWCADPSARTLKESLALPTDRAAYHDNSPVSLASATSMGALNEWMEHALPVTRFRPNLVVEGAETAFEEDGWGRLRIGEVVLRVAAPIDRCVLTMVDADTLDRGKDPIRTLAVHRRWDGTTWFAVHLMIEQQGTIQVGDRVVVE